jgi:hypothetical protein
MLQLRHTGQVTMTLLIGLGAACAGDLPQPSPPPSTPPIYLIEPSGFTIPAGASIQLRVVPATAAPVTWELDAGSPGSLSTAGLFSTTLCGAMGPAQVHARIDVVPPQTATAQMSVASPSGGAPVSIQSITYGSPDTPARIDSLAGTVTVQVIVEGAPSACISTSAVYLETVVGNTTTILDSLMINPPSTVRSSFTLHWDTTKLPNGAYPLRARALLAPLTPSAITPSTTVQVRNP